MAKQANQEQTVVRNEAVEISTKVKSIRVYSNGENIRYRVTFDKDFKAFTKTEADEYVETDVNYIDFIPRVFIAQCLSLVDGLDLIYTKKKEQSLRNDGAGAFGAAELQVVLKDAKLVLERTKFEAGDEYIDADGVVHTHEYAGYNTAIKDIKVSEKMQAKLDQIIDKMLGL